MTLAGGRGDSGLHKCPLGGRLAERKLLLPTLVVFHVLINPPMPPAPARRRQQRWAFNLSFLAVKCDKKESLSGVQELCAEHVGHKREEKTST